MVMDEAAAASHAAYRKVSREDAHRACQLTWTLISDRLSCFGIALHMLSFVVVIQKIKYSIMNV